MSHTWTTESLHSDAGMCPPRIIVFSPSFHPLIIENHPAFFLAGNGDQTDERDAKSSHDSTVQKPMPQHSSIHAETAVDGADSRLINISRHGKVVEMYNALGDDTVLVLSLISRKTAQQKPPMQIGHIVLTKDGFFMLCFEESVGRRLKINWLSAESWAVHKPSGADPAPAGIYGVGLTLSDCLFFELSLVDLDNPRNGCSHQVWLTFSNYYNDQGTARFLVDKITYVARSDCLALLPARVSQ